MLDQTFDLFDKLGASDEQLDFPVIYASALRGYASPDETATSGDMTPLVRGHHELSARRPTWTRTGRFRCRSVPWTTRVISVAIGIGRIARGRIRRNNAAVKVIDLDGKVRNERMVQLMGFLGLDRVEIQEAEAGDIIAFAGAGNPQISDTVCDPRQVEALPPLTVDEPTISMSFETNNSPFCGKDGKFVTSRQIRERLMREASHNVALRVEDTEEPERFLVSGRGELHLAISAGNHAARRLRDGGFAPAGDLS